MAAGMAIQENVQQAFIVEEIYRAWKRIEEQWPSLPRKLAGLARRVETPLIST